MATREHHVLSCDIETYSEVDLPKCGVYAYAEHHSGADRTGDHYSGVHRRRDDH